MPKDDFVRIVYPKTVDGRKKRTSISVDPDLYHVFTLIRGSVPAARAQLRNWAIDVEAQRTEELARIGASRLVGRRVMTEIRTLVERGLKVTHPHEPKEALTRPVKQPAPQGMPE